MEWQVYHDGTYGYEIRYPPDYIIIERARQLELQPLSQVLFQDHMLANSDTAALQPPKFYIEVFDNSSQLPVEQWLEAHGLLGGAKKFQMEPYSLAGVEGARVSSPLLMAPNSFIYLPRGNYIFKLTPTDERSEQVLATFKFTE